MTPLQKAMLYDRLRDEVLSMLFDLAPQLLQDDVVLEGLLHLLTLAVMREVRQGRQEHFASLRAQLAHPQ